ncbi:MAG: signal recognition particle-docking protein FtsY, partial [Betaproteobacteria bacterium]|nr:signal recognition particle-docking protein FtsY [Betaproteobacteria bacterium]
MFGFLKKPKSEAPATPEAVPASTPAATPEAAPAPRSWRERLFAGLSRTRAQLGGKLKSVFARGKVDDELLEELET